MKRHWTNEELAEHWTLSSKELDLIGDSKTDHTRLGAACLLKYFQYEGRFPAQKQDVPPIVIVHLAQQVEVGLGFVQKPLKSSEIRFTSYLWL
jgi:Domain of unknown function (DUF4158)